MSVEAESIVWDIVGLKPVDKLLLLYIADSAVDYDRTGFFICDLSEQQICERTGLLPDDLIASLNRLSKMGWLVYRPSPDGFWLQINSTKTTRLVEQEVR